MFVEVKLRADVRCVLDLSSSVWCKRNHHKSVILIAMEHANHVARFVQENVACLFFEVFHRLMLSFPLLKQTLLRWLIRVHTKVSCLNFALGGHCWCRLLDEC